MAWETRRGTKLRYYYRAERVDGRVRKICCGSGRLGAQAARQDAETRAARAADEAAALAAEAELEPLERLSVELDEQMDLLLEAHLLAGGFHQHKGQWRKRHGCQTNTDVPDRVRHGGEETHLAEPAHGNHAIQPPTGHRHPGQ